MSSNQSKKTTVVAIQQAWSGPLPPPERLAQFESIVPGSAKTIMDAFQKQTDHRIEIENYVIKGNGRKEKRGQIFGLIIALVGMGLGTLCILNGHDIAGGTIGGIPLISLVSVFVIGKRKQSQELKEKDNIKTK